MTTPDPQPGPKGDERRPLPERLAVGLLYGMGGITMLLALVALATKSSV